MVDDFRGEASSDVEWFLSFRTSKVECSSRRSLPSGRLLRPPFSEVENRSLDLNHIFRDSLAIQFSETEPHLGAVALWWFLVGNCRRGMLLIRDRVLVVNSDRIFFHPHRTPRPKHPILWAVSSFFSWDPGPKTRPNRPGAMITTRHETCKLENLAGARNRSRNLRNPGANPARSTPASPLKAGPSRCAGLRGSVGRAHPLRPRSLEQLGDRRGREASNSSAIPASNSSAIPALASNSSAIPARPRSLEQLGDSIAAEKPRTARRSKRFLRSDESTSPLHTLNDAVFTAVNTASEEDPFRRRERPGTAQRI